MMNWQNWAEQFLVEIDPEWDACQQNWESYCKKQKDPKKCDGKIPTINEKTMNCCWRRDACKKAR
jgi:hypothetical protein